MSDKKVTKLGRLPDGALDSYYIEEYLEAPAKKSEAYLKAYDRYCNDCKTQGIEAYNVNRDYARQYAKSIHDRLRDRINTELYKLADDDKALGRRVLRELANKAESESVKAQCASNLAKGLYPEHIVTKSETIEDIDRELKQLEQDINQSIGLH